MSQTYKLYLKDILKSIDKIIVLTTNIDKDDFLKDDTKVDAVMYNLAIIGEAIKNIPDEIRAKTPEARWREAARFRDRAIHHYFDIDLDIVWEITQQHLAELRIHVEKILQEPE